MANFCCVRICISNSAADKKENGPTSVFNFPKNQISKEKWLRAIPGELRKSNYVCSKHFDKGFIIDSDNILGVCKEYKRKRLTNDAYPTIFEGFPSHYQRKIHKLG